MLNVFADAGWAAQRSFVDGTVRVRFSIEPTDGVDRGDRSARARAEGASTARLLAPRSIAVIGASRHAGTIGHELFRNLLAYGFQGPVYPVNPTSVVGRGRARLPEHPRRPRHDRPRGRRGARRAVPDIVDDCAKKGVRGVVIISAGFAEVGPSGREAEQAIVATARRNGMRVIGPNCLGIVNTAPDVQMNATFAPVEPVRGRSRSCRSRAASASS